MSILVPIAIKGSSLRSKPKMLYSFFLFNAPDGSIGGDSIYEAEKRLLNTMKRAMKVAETRGTRGS